MQVFLEMIAQPFMQRALLAGLALAALLAALGVFVTLRKMAFFGDGIAHSSLAGIAIAVLAGWSPLPIAMAWAVAVAVAIYLLERSTRLPSDTLIGIFFTASMALGVALMSLTGGYQPELITYLFGSILSVRPGDLTLIAGTAAVILAWLTLYFRELTYMSLAPENAAVSGVPVARHTLTLYVALAIATVLGVKMLGIVLVSALMVLPPATSRMLTSTFRGFVAGSVLLSALMTCAGLAVSYLYDLPSGASIILSGAAIFFFAAAASRLARRLDV
jgi:ABC-type Mn2+/Zn2+ transport system permease subunit